MTFQQFIEKYNGEYVEVAGSADAKNQCVDLVNAYIREVLTLPIIEWTNAKDFPTKVGSDYDYILNSPTGVPLEGDLVIWGGTYGHIAIFVEGNSNSFKSFDQNYPVGSPCHIQGHGYSNVLGWLHCKKENTSQVILDQSDAFIVICTKLNVAANKDLALAEIDKLIALEDQVVQKGRQLSDAQIKIAELEGKIVILTKDHDDFAVKSSLTIENQGYEIKSLTNEIGLLKEQINAPTKTGWQLILTGLKKLLAGG